MDELDESIKNHVREQEPSEVVAPDAEKEILFHSTAEKINKWFDNQGWSGNPFVLNIIPSIFVGYEEQKNKLIACIEENHKLCLVLGATGSGKTTALRWLLDNLKKNKKFITVFISKAPNKPEGFIEIFNNLFKPPWYLSFLNLFMPNIKNVHQIPDFLNQKLKDKHIIILCDEAHEASVNVLQWLRVITDQVNNMSVILFALPMFEDILKKKLETFYKRVTTKITLSSLTKEDVKELIEKRIDNVAKEPNRNNPFPEETIDAIFRQTGGFPREVLRVCDMAINKAIERNINRIEPDMIKEKRIEKEKTADIKSMPKRQREIVDAIRLGRATPGEIVDAIDLSKYKSRQHALRSVNNILQRLKQDGIVERERRGKTFVYSLGPKASSLVVEA